MKRTEPEPDAEEGDGDEGSRQEAPYYLRNMRVVARHAVESGLFDGSDEERFLRGLESLPESAQRLFVRLLLRKGPVFSMPKLESRYPEIQCGASEALRALQSAGFLSVLASVSGRPVAAEVLGLASAEGLRKIAAALGRKPCHGPACWPRRKEELAPAILDHLAARKSVQRTLDGRDQVFGMIERAVGMPCVKLDPMALTAFSRALSLFTLSNWSEFSVETGSGSAEGRLSAASLVMRADLGILNYPAYEVDDSARPFPNREALLMYDSAMCLAGRLRDCIDCVDRESSLSLIRDVYAKLSNDVDVGKRPVLRDVGNELMVHCTVVPIAGVNVDLEHPVPLARSFLSQKFSAEWVYTRALHHGLRLLEKERLYADACCCLVLLLSRDLRPGCRGEWWERLSIDLEHMRHKGLALRVAEESLRDPFIGPYTASCRAMQKRVKQLSKLPLRLVPPRLPCVFQVEPCHVRVHGKRCGKSSPGMKATFVGMDGSAVTVEQLCIEHYRSLGWAIAEHCESGPFLALFTLLFWDVIFDSAVKGVFLTRFQEAPLDFGTTAFFQSRQRKIDERISTLAALDGPTISAEVEESWKKHYGVPCVGVRWEGGHDCDLLSRTALCMGPRICAVMKLLAVDGSSWRSGLPDLLLLDPAARKMKLAEVKSEHDTLSAGQEAWIHQLLVVAGIDVDLCSVIN